MQTLYSQLRAAEKVNEKIKARLDDFNGYLRQFASFPGYHETHPSAPEIDIKEAQRRIMKGFEKNPVFYDAITGRQGIEDSLIELGRVNRPVRRLFPRARNKQHNQRLDQMTELIGYQEQLRTNGLLVPDNFFNLQTMITGVSFGIGYLASNYLFINPTPEMIDLYRTTMPLLMSLFMSPLTALIASTHTDGPDRTEEARYVDSKVLEFYR